MISTKSIKKKGKKPNADKNDNESPNFPSPVVIKNENSSSPQSNKKVKSRNKVKKIELMDTISKVEQAEAEINNEGGSEEDEKSPQFQQEDDSNESDRDGIEDIVNNSSKKVENSFSPKIVKKKEISIHPEQISSISVKVRQ